MLACRKSNRHFEFCNPNPKGYVTQGDCVTRALSLAIGKTWKDTLLVQCLSAQDEGYSISGKDNIEKVLRMYGYEKQKMPRHKDNTMYTVREYCLEMRKTGRKQPIVLDLPNHLTVLKQKNGKYKIHDTWDCGEKTVRQVYVKSEEV